MTARCVGGVELSEYRAIVYPLLVLKCFDCSLVSRWFSISYRPVSSPSRSNSSTEMQALQHDQLLPEGEIFQEQASMRLQAAGEQAQP